MSDMDVKNKGGRPLKLTVPVKLKVYALHLKKYWAHEIKDILEKHGIELSEDSIRTAIKWARDEVPRTTEQETLLEAIDASNQRIKELNEKRDEIKNKISMGNIYLGYTRAIREEEEFRSKLEGTLKLHFHVDKDTVGALYDLMSINRDDQS